MPVKSCRPEPGSQKEFASGQHGWWKAEPIRVAQLGSQVGSGQQGVNRAVRRGPDKRPQAGMGSRQGNWGCKAQPDQAQTQGALSACLLPALWLTAPLLYPEASPLYRPPWHLEAQGRTFCSSPPSSWKLTASTPLLSAPKAAGGLTRHATTLYLDQEGPSAKKKQK